MNPARITNEAAREFVSELDDEYGLYSPDGLTEAAIDQVIDEVDRELADEQRTAERRAEHSFNDVRRIHRARRRAERERLEALVQHRVAFNATGEAA